MEIELGKTWLVHEEEMKGGARIELEGTQLIRKEEMNEEGKFGEVTGNPIAGIWPTCEKEIEWGGVRGFWVDNVW